MLKIVTRFKIYRTMVANAKKFSIASEDFSNQTSKISPIKSIDINLPKSENYPIEDRSESLLPTATPFAQICHPQQIPNETSPASDIGEFVDSLGPPLPISFNLGAYVNRSESLQKLVQLGVNLSEIEMKPERAKYILGLDFEKDMKQHIQFLHDHNVPAENIGRFITKNPFIFRESLENLEIRINYLKSKSFTDSAISRIITTTPLFLNLNTKTVDQRLGFFQKQFSLTGNEVRYLIERRPQLITFSFDKFRERLFTIHEELGFKGDELKNLLLTQPKMWTLSIKSLKDRFHVVHNLMGISHEQILQYPEVFLKRSFLLHQRHQYLVHLSRAQYNPNLPLYVSLRDIATTVDSEFCSKCAHTSVEEYNSFLKTL